MSKYNETLNEHLVGIKAICAFRYGMDKICIIELPDFENTGYVQGWIFVINTTPYFYSVAGGSEGIHKYIQWTYAEYLHGFVANGNATEDKQGIVWDDGYDCWTLNSDNGIEFNECFTEAMADEGFIMKEDGGWERREGWTIEDLLDHIAENKLTMTVSADDGSCNTFWLSYFDGNTREDEFDYEDCSTEQCRKTRSEIIAMYPNRNRFIEGQQDDND